MMPKEKKPNIVFAFADDWGRYASIYSKYENVAPLTSSVNEFIHTPNFDRYGNMGCAKFKGGVQNQTDFKPKETTFQGKNDILRNG